MRKRRILMFGAVDFSIDNAPKIHFYNLAKEFVNLGFEVLCSIYVPEKISNKFENKIFRISYSPNPLTGNILIRIFKYLLLVPVILWQVFKFNPDIIYFRFSPPAFLYLFSLKSFKFFYSQFKIVVEFNDWSSEQRAIQKEHEFKVKIIEYLQVKSVWFADYVRVVTPGIKKKLNNFNMDSEKIFVIGNGTDTNHFKPTNKTQAKKNIGLDPKIIYVGFIGNLSVWQGLNVLFDAIPEVLKVFKDARFLIIGDGPEMKKVKKAKKNFKENLIVTGRIAYEKANMYINAFDIGVAPFIKERNENIGLSPLKIYDYASCGTPVVASEIKGLGIIEENNFGILVEPENPIALAKAITRLLKNINLRKKLGQNGRKTAKENFSWSKTAKQIIKTITS